VQHPRRNARPHFSLDPTSVRTKMRAPLDMNIRSILLLLVITLVGLATLRLPAIAQPKQQKARAPLTIEKVADDLYVIIGNGGNVGVLVTDEGVILVDDKFEPDYDAIIAQVKTVTNQPVKYVFNTHHHGDHSGGNIRFIAIAEIISHKNARENMVPPKAAAGATGRPARIVFTDETSVFLGGKEVRARYFGRGHTNGDIIVYFPAQRVIHTGDLMAGVTPLIDYNGGGSVVEWVRTVDAAMGALDFDKVIPGHGDVTNKAGLKTYRDNVAKLRDDVTAMVRQGKSKEEVRAALAAQYPAVYGNPASLQNQWSLPGFMTELK
jgi:cyclase